MISALPLLALGVNFFLSSAVTDMFQVWKSAATPQGICVMYMFMRPAFTCRW